MTGLSEFPPERRPEFLPRYETLPQIVPVPLLTLQVSRDGGRIWDDTQTISSGDSLDPLSDAAWPPCQCPRCRAEEQAVYRQERRRSRR
ncbi:hypothetical protein [Streptomyces cadmiisoli]|uniref:hypothetical protein n=1 Tax=Streptomyces cadmiisoli TaxID=2184053 RepID=UPI003648E58C